MDSSAPDQFLIRAAGGILSVGPSGRNNVVLSSLAGLPEHGWVSVADANGTAQAVMFVDPAGNGLVTADVKNFRADNPADPETEIWYACIEGPEAAAYVRGTATLVNGQATIPLPDHFAAVAVAEGMTVQVSPHSADSLGLAVVERSIKRIVVRELQRGRGSYEFDWRVEAVRKGFEDYKVIRPRLEVTGSSAKPTTPQPVGEHGIRGSN